MSSMTVSYTLHISINISSHHSQRISCENFILSNNFRDTCLVIQVHSELISSWIKQLPLVKGLERGILENLVVNTELLPKDLLKSMYVSFLAGCFRSVRFGLKEAHGKGQALQFNWLYRKGAFILHSDGTFSVDFTKVDGAVESLSREILTIQAKGDKVAAKSLLQEYAEMSQPLSAALEKLERVQVPVDITPIFGVADTL